MQVCGTKDSNKNISNGMTLAIILKFCGIQSKQRLEEDIVARRKLKVSKLSIQLKKIKGEIINKIKENRNNRKNVLKMKPVKQY